MAFAPTDDFCPDWFDSFSADWRSTELGSQKQPDFFRGATRQTSSNKSEWCQSCSPHSQAVCEVLAPMGQSMSEMKL